MAVDFSQFTSKTTPLSTDYLVGYDLNAVGGEKKFTLSTIANAVSGIMNSQLGNVYIPKPATASAQQVLTYSGTTQTWVASAAPTGTSSEASAKAWVNFNGKAFTNTTYPATSSSVIRTSYNVSSITEKALGWYEVNFTNPLPEQYVYALSLSAIVADGSGDVIFHEGPYTSTKFGISVDNNTGAGRNESFMNCAIFFAS